MNELLNGQSGRPTDVPETPQRVSRRKLLQILAASGGAVAATALLPEEWVEPVVEVGVLPAHAQVSPTPTPTATPIPPYAITSCTAFNAAGGGIIGPTDTMRMYADILPADPGIQLQRTITPEDPGHPLHRQQVDVDTGLTDASGRCTSADYDLRSIVPPVSSGSQVVIRWEFVNPSDGVNMCVNRVDIA